MSEGVPRGSRRQSPLRFWVAGCGFRFAVGVCRATVRQPVSVFRDSDFEIRISGFGFLSGYGFRVEAGFG